MNLSRTYLFIILFIIFLAIVYGNYLYFLSDKDEVVEIYLEDIAEDGIKTPFGEGYVTLTSMEGETKERRDRGLVRPIFGMKKERIEVQRQRRVSRKKEEVLPTLFGILYSENRHVANIDHDILKEGEKVKGVYTVLRIEPGRVLLKKGREVFVLLPKGVQKE